MKYGVDLPINPGINYFIELRKAQLAAKRYAYQARKAGRPVVFETSANPTMVASCYNQLWHKRGTAHPVLGLVVVQ